MSLEYLVDEKSIDQTSVELTGWANPLARLREALEKDEFALYCQPVAAVQAGGARFPMAEVLVRMRHLLARLKALGVGFAQGFGVAKPQPIESFSAKP
jgi:EAL domain-containing protein (putative c-di-GMP-specific phosphodiesterase class I)